MLSENAKVFLADEKGEPEWWKEETDKLKKYLSGELELDEFWKQQKEINFPDNKEGFKDRIKKHIEIREEVYKYLDNWKK